MNVIHTHKLKKNIIVSNLLMSLLLIFSHHSMALDLNSALKNAVKKQIKQRTGQNNAPISTSANENSKATTVNNPQIDSTDTTAGTSQKPQTAINWKNPSKEEEIALGREITGNLLGAAPLVKDENLQKYVNSVGRWVASQSERPDLPWHFGVIESEDLNAFSAAGGYVMITKGLYRKMSNEAQLAGVLGHEIAHIVAKHQLKVLQKQQLLNFGASLLSKKLGNDNKIISKAIGSGAEISARGLDKEAEFEADRLGLSYATRAGYEPFGLTEVLQILGQVNSNDNSVALLFKTHPLPDERLVSLSESIDGKLDDIKNGKTLENRFYKITN